MANLQSLERANTNNYLWPTIADAVDTFLKRRASGADSYERIWRLIHIWEAIEITLATAAMARHKIELESETTLRKCREYFYGMSWNQVTKNFKSSQGASDGSIDQWINILEEMSKASSVQTGFLKALQDFLDEECIDLKSLVQAWGRACDVTPTAREKDMYKVKEAMRHINSFRNRFAHVPFPHDPLDELAQSLENVTEQLFSIEPSPSKHVDQGQVCPLTGSWGIRRSLLRGSMHYPSEDDFSDAIKFVFPCMRAKKSDELEQWPAIPFVYIDTMMRPHVITRIKNEQGNCEYTRFRAEANAIIFREIRIQEDFPQPKPAEYEVEEEEAAAEVVKESTVTFSQAIEAIRQENYDEPIAFFEDLTRKRPDYHIGWLRLGHTKREKAVRLPDQESENTVKLLREAVNDLAKATKHKDREYQARAYYELSKAHFHLARKGYEEVSQIADAQECAQRACVASSDPKYQSWLEYIKHSSLVKESEPASTPNAAQHGV